MTAPQTVFNVTSALLGTLYYEIHMSFSYFLERTDCVTYCVLNVFHLMFTQMIMAKCQSVLESADTPELLVAVVDVISFIVKVRPQCFQRHFRVIIHLHVHFSLTVCNTHLFRIPHCQLIALFRAVYLDCNLRDAISGASRFSDSLMLHSAFLVSC
jgi:hypothetical protein